MEFIVWINGNEGFAIVMLTGVLAVLNYLLLQHSIKTEKINGRPKIVLYLHPTKKNAFGMLDLSIINYGNSLAFDINIKAETSKEELEKNRISTIGHDILSFIPVLPSGESLTTFFASAFEKKDSEIKHVKYTVTFRSESNERFEEQFSIPIHYLEGFEKVGDEPLVDIANKIKELSENVKKIQNSK